jgi:hypothetical protein
MTVPPAVDATPTKLKLLFHHGAADAGSGGEGDAVPLYSTSLLSLTMERLVSKRLCWVFKAKVRGKSARLLLRDEPCSVCTSVLSEGVINESVIHLCVQLDSLTPILFLTLQVILGTKVGRAKHMRIMPGGLGADQRLGGPSSVFVGRKLTITVAPFTWNTPWIRVLLQENGWDAMERLLEVRTT